MNSLESVGLLIGIISGIFAIVGGVYKYYKVFIEPRRTKTKLENLLPLIQEWFDEIDCYMEKDLNIYSLHNKEEKIREYIEKHLKNYKIKPTKKIIREWNSEMGIKKELQDSLEIFEKYARIPPEGMHLDIFVNLIFGKFYEFYDKYKSNNAEDYNFAEVEMPVKFLKFYVERI